MENCPVGRIEFLGMGGTVRESIEYTSERQFVEAIKKENYYGVPMSIVLYQDAGGTIDQEFLQSLDPPPQGFRIEPYANRQIEEEEPDRRMAEEKEKTDQQMTEEKEKPDQQHHLTRHSMLGKGR